MLCHINFNKQATARIRTKMCETTVLTVCNYSKRSFNFNLSIIIALYKYM